MTAKPAVVIAVLALRRFVAEIFERVGSSPAESARIAHYLVAANLSGHDSHGVIRVAGYVQAVRDGFVIPDQEIAVPVDTPVLAVVDGRFGFGQTVAPQAVQIGMDKATALGVSAVALRDCGHIGRIGDWAEMAAEGGLVSVHFVNAAGSVLVAPFGGVERRLSTAPFCVGVPRPGHHPVVLDFATSLVAEGKVLMASRGGKALPQDALIGSDGSMSTDPTLLYGPHTADGPRNHRYGLGAIRAFGEHKGSGLALICELLGGALTGNGATKPDRPFSNGMLSFYIDPVRLDTAEFFSCEVARYLTYFKSTRPATPAGEVLFPGEPEERTRAERARNGVPLPPETWASITQTALEVGLSRDWITAAEEGG